jgi:hypothetical protein
METIMRLTVLGTMALIMAVVGDVRPSEARPWYPWCAQYADRTGITECAFTSFKQCQATVSGIGGSCIQNWYPQPTGPQPRHPRNWRPFYQ